MPTTTSIPNRTRIADGVRHSILRFNQARGEITWVSIGQAIAFLGAFASVKILTNLMGTRGYGELALGITVAGSVQMYIYGPLGQVVLRFFAVNRERGDLPVYFALVRRLHIYCALLLVSAALVIAGVLHWRHSQWTLIVLFGLLYGVVSGFNISFSQFQAAIRQRKIVAFHQAADNWLRPLLSVVLLIAYRNSGYVALVAFFCATAVIDVSQAIFASRNRELRSNWNGTLLDPVAKSRTSREMYAYATPLVMWAGVGAISMFGDRWTLQYLYGAQQVGIYAALYQIANAPLSLAAGAANQLMIPIIFQRAGAGETEAQLRSAKRFLYKSIALFVSAMAVLGVLLFFFGAPLARFAASHDVAQWHRLLWVVFTGIVFYQVGQQLIAVGQIHRSTRRYVAAFATNAVATLVFSYWLGLRMGITGVAWAMVISNFLFMLTVIFLNRGFTTRIPDALSQAVNASSN